MPLPPLYSLRMVCPCLLSVPTAWYAVPDIPSLLSIVVYLLMPCALLLLMQRALCSEYYMLMSQINPIVSKVHNLELFVELHIMFIYNNSHACR